MPRSGYAVLPLLFAIIPEDGIAQPTSSATYEVVFESTWSETTHPTDFPGNPHFSGLIGGTHNSDVTFWMPGELASQGIETMAERGQKGDLTTEVEAAIDDGTAEFVLSGGGINPSPGSTTLTFEIGPDKPLVTLVSMVAPSPDWFVGVHGLNMIEDGDWRDTITVTLDVYDAGTDSGPSYTSPNDDTDPAEPIAILNTGPFAQSTVVGTYTFTRREVVRSSEELPEALEVVGPYPNPTSGRFSLNVEGVLGGLTEVSLFDVTGRLVVSSSLEASLSQGQLQFDVSDLTPSIYIVRIVRGERVVTRSLVVVE
jgi:hypothetical protein